MITMNAAIATNQHAHSVHVTSLAALPRGSLLPNTAAVHPHAKPFSGMPRIGPPITPGNGAKHRMIKPVERTGPSGVPLSLLTVAVVAIIFTRLA